jgi:hypothetical protein
MQIAESFSFDLENSGDHTPLLLATSDVEEIYIRVLPSFTATRLSSDFATKSLPNLSPSSAQKKSRNGVMGS